MINESLKKNSSKCQQSNKYVGQKYSCLNIEQTLWNFTAKNPETPPKELAWKILRKLLYGTADESRLWFRCQTHRVS